MNWRMGQDSNLHILSDGGFQDRCTTNYATPPQFKLSELYRRQFYVLNFKACRPGQRPSNRAQLVSRFLPQISTGGVTRVISKIMNSRRTSLCRRKSGCASSLVWFL